MGGRLGQAQADKDLPGLITEALSPDERRGVRVLLCGIIVCLHFILIRKFFLDCCTRVFIERADLLFPAKPLRL